MEQPNFSNSSSYHAHYSVSLCDMNLTLHEADGGSMKKWRELYQLWFMATHIRVKSIGIAEDAYR